jgi:hypothetical protein
MVNSPAPILIASRLISRDVFVFSLYTSLNHAVISKTKKDDISFTPSARKEPLRQPALPSGMDEYEFTTP